MIASEQLVEMGEGVNSCEETTVQPSSSLENQFGHGIRHIGFSCSGFDVLKNPVTIALRNQLETKDTILSEIHVGREDTSVGTVHLLTSKVLLEWSISSFVVL